MSKPRSDSVLKTLPPERQEEIVEYARDHSLKETVAWLWTDGITTSKSALSVFLLHWELKEEVRANENAVATLLEEFKQNNPDFDPAKLEAMGSAFFTALSLRQKDSQTFVAMEQLRLKKNQLALDREKFEELKRKAGQAEQTDKVLSDAELTPEQRAQRIKEIYGRA